MNVAVIGQGFVGLTLSVFLGLNKFQVFGVENNQWNFSCLVLEHKCK